MEQKRIDEYFKYKSLVKEATAYMKEVEKDALEEAEKLKENSKQKTFAFYGSGSSCIEVIEAEKLEMVSPTGLMSLLNNNADAFIKGEMKYSIDAKFTKLVKDVVAGNYIDVTFEEALTQVVSRSGSEEAAKVLRKKLKGVFAKDKELLESYGNPAASEDAYLLQEAKAYSNVITLANAYNLDKDEFISKLKSLMYVDMTLKIKATEGDSE